MIEAEEKKKCDRGKRYKTIGRGLVNTIINKLPFELHVPTYQYCGPGTHLEKRLKRNDPGINKLDQACKEHDIAYSNSKNIADRNQADRILAKSAWDRAKSSDASMAEKAVALGVAGIMKAKSKMGMGIKSRKKKNKKLGQIRRNKMKKLTVKQIFREATKTARDVIKKKKPKTLPDAAKLALTAAKLAVKGKRPGKDTIKNELPRVIPVPKIGGVLPLIPIFAGLSALGALLGGSASVANAVISAKNAKKRLKEAHRHNETIEAIALNQNAKTGSGLFLKPYKTGLGLFISPDPKNL